jgi:hypothetical protein
MARQCTLWHSLVRASHQCSHYWTPSTNLAKSANLVKLQRIYNGSNQQARTNTWPEKITKRFPISWIIRDTAWHPLVHTSGRMFFLPVCFHIQSRIIILCIKVQSAICTFVFCCWVLFLSCNPWGICFNICQGGNLGGNVCSIQLGAVQLVELASKMMACLKFVGCSSPD